MVPPVDVEDVDVCGAKHLERCVDGEVQRFGVVPDVVDFLGNRIVTAQVTVSVLMEFMRKSRESMTIWYYFCGNDKLVANAALLSPLADEFFRGLILATRHFRNVNHTL